MVLAKGPHKAFPKLNLKTNSLVKLLSAMHDHDVDIGMVTCSTCITAWPTEKLLPKLRALSCSIHYQATELLEPTKLAAFRQAVPSLTVLHCKFRSTIYGPKVTTPPLLLLFDPQLEDFPFLCHVTSTAIEKEMFDMIVAAASAGLAVPDDVWKPVMVAMTKLSFHDAN
jgi:hypothetical protein